MTNQQLLDDYVSERSEAAFRALVVRHGPAVLRACSRVLRDPDEVEDAFQATFLVFVRKAPTIRDPETLGNWLYGVARRVAMRARRDASRRRDHEMRRAAMTPARDEPGRPWDDSDGVLLEELARLPGSYRGPLELCYLRGRSHEEAADELGWPLGTLKTRLVRGRRKLRGRLVRRGIGLGIGLLLWPGRRVAASTVPEGLVDSTVEAMLVDDRGGSVAEAGFARASELARLRGPTAGPRWLGPLLLLLATALAASLGIGARSQARASEFEDFASLPANLTDVLNVDCR